MLSSSFAMRAQNGATLNVLSYNVRNCTGMDGKRDIARVAKVIESTAADVAGIQEVDSVTGRSKGAYILGDLASECLYRPVFAPAIDYDGGKYGIGILSKERPISVTRIALPGREEQRALVVAEFENYRLANTHLSLTPDDALASVAIIEGYAKANNDKPFIITGDWNTKPGEPALEAMKEAGFAIVSGEENATWPADNPTDCIDYVAVYRPDDHGVACIGCQVLNEPMASDHRPLLVKLKLKSGL